MGLVRRIAQVIGCVYAPLVCARLVVTFFMHPFSFFTVKKRTLPPPGYTKPSWDESVARAGDVNLHYVAAGRPGKPLMLFVHGFPECWYSWRHQLDYFKDRFYCVAIDQRGYGDSSKPAGIEEYTAAKLAADIKAFVESQKYDKFILVGHDWGGAVAWTFALSYPEMVDRLIIMNCPHPAVFGKYLRSNLRQFFMSWYMFLFQLPYLPEMLMWNCDMKFLNLYKTKDSGFKLSRCSDEDVECYKYSFRDSNFTGPVNFYRAMFQSLSLQSKEKFRRLEMPVQIVWGTGDMALSLPMAELSAQKCANCELKLIEGASHWVQQDAPEEVNRLVDSFLASRA